MLTKPLFDERGFERRWVPGEVRLVEGADGKPRIEGYAALFNVWSEDLGGFREIVRPGTFDETVEIDDIRALKNHDVNLLLGRNKSDTLELANDETGLYYRIAPGNQSYTTDLIESIERGDCDQSSFGFRTLSDRWGTEEEEHIRELLKVKLYDVSPVTFAAYPQTSVAVRDLFGQRGVCWDGLCSVMVRSGRGLPLNEQDQEILQRSITVLDGLRTQPDAGQELQVLAERAHGLLTSGEVKDPDSRKAIEIVTRTLIPFLPSDLQAPEPDERSAEDVDQERDILQRRLEVEENSVI